MRSKLEILSVETLSGISKKSGKPYVLNICQCVKRGVKEDGTMSVEVGELVLPQSVEIPPAGEYYADFEIAVDRETKRIGARLTALTSVTAKPLGQSVIDKAAAQASVKAPV